ncbi:MAG: TfoX/Sxy family protein [bacterium]|nr:TfoX/Sxy family protein [bacterium]
MANQKASEELTNYLEELLVGYNVTRRNMFGCPVFFAHDHLFVGVDRDYIFLRLSERDRELFKTTYDEAEHFDPMDSGKGMREYMVLPDHLCTNESEVSLWLEKSYQYVLSLPPKKKRKK